MQGRKIGEEGKGNEVGGKEEGEVSGFACSLFKSTWWTGGRGAAQVKNGF